MGYIDRQQLANLARNPLPQSNLSGNWRTQVEKLGRGYAEVE